MQEWLPERWIQEGVQYRAQHRHAYIPFGLGYRGCIGNSLAMLQVQVLLVAILIEVDFMVPEGAVIVLEQGLTLNAKFGVNLTTRALPK